MSLLGDLMGGGGNESNSETVSTLHDQRAVVGERGILVRDRGSVTITDGGAVNAAIKGNIQGLRRVLDFSTESQRGSFAFGSQAMGLLATAYKDAKGMDTDTNKMLMLAIGGAMIVGALAVMRKG